VGTHNAEGLPSTTERGGVLALVSCYAVPAGAHIADDDAKMIATMGAGWRMSSVVGAPGGPQGLSVGTR
jgi:hypothetical protein